MDNPDSIDKKSTEVPVAAGLRSEARLGGAPFDLRKFSFLTVDEEDPWSNVLFVFVHACWY
jgi:hypothetical protein